MSTEPQPTQEEKVIEEQILLGNVSYTATVDELSSFLEDYQVETIELPKRLTRRRGHSGVVEVSSGKALVTFKTVDEAKKALEELDGQEWKGRKLFAKQSLPPSLRPKRPALVKKKKVAKNTEETSAPNSASSDESQSPESNNASVEEEEVKENNKPSRKQKTKAKKEVSSKPKVQKVPLSQGIPSKDTVFIENLEENVTAKQVREFFTELEPLKVVVPRRSLSPSVYRTLKKKNVPIRNKGIGFIKFASEEKQLEAIEKFNGKEISNQAITLSVLIETRSTELPESNGEGPETKAVEA